MSGNVLFITVDQWRGDCLSSLGHPVVRTPTLDRLAAGGVTFTRHWANTAPCGPSRATLYTGMYAHNHRSVLNGTPLDAWFTNVALVARSIGYDPVLFGYTDATVDPRTVTDPDDPRLRSYEGVLPGFRAEVLLTGEDLSAWARWLTARGVDVPANPAELHLPIPDYPKAGDHGESWVPARYAAEHSEAAFITDEVTAWLDRQAAEDDAPPWFAHVSYIRPHPPYRAPEGYHDRYDPADGPPFRRHPDRDTETANHLIHQFAVEVVGCPVDEAEARQLRATYWGNMAEVDHQLGILLDHLDATGQADDTLVVLTSDHGDQMGDHWLVEKLGWWDESYHVPLIVRDPRPEADATRGRRVEAVTEHVDVTPTICEWLGVEAPLQCDGLPLQPFLHGPTAGPDDWRTEAHWEWDFRSPETHLAEDLLGVTMEECCLVVLRTERWKYVHVAAGGTLLFDLVEDPDQLVNLAGDPIYATVLAECAGRLLSWRMRHDDRTLTGHIVTDTGLVTRRDPRR